jgi:hypothetical protein
MEEVSLLFLFLSIFSFFSMLLGLYKPWVVLWWEDVQNRKKVIQLYGSIGVICYLVYFVLQFI